MQYLQKFYLNGQLICQNHRPTAWRGNTPYPPTSKMFVCKYCCRIYAEVWVWNGDNVVPFQPYMRCCESCWLRNPAAGSFFDAPDSIWIALEQDYLAYLPEPWLIWELHAIDLLPLRKRESYDTNPNPS